MRPTFIYFFIFLIFGQIYKIQTRSMNFTGVNVKFNQKYLSNFTSWIRDGSISVDMVTVRELHYGLRANIEVQIKIDNSRKYQTLFSYDFDLCKLLNEIFKESLMRTWFRSLLKYGNLMENCPVAAGHYYIRNMRFESNAIPAYLRPGEYRMNVHDYYGKRKTKKEDLVVLVAVDLRIY